MRILYSVYFALCVQYISLKLFQCMLLLSKWAHRTYICVVVFWLVVFVYFVYILHCVGAVYFSAGCCLACVFVCILCIFVYLVYFLYFVVCSVFQCKLLLSMRAHRTRRSVDRQDRAIHQGPTPTRHNALVISRRF